MKAIRKDLTTFVPSNTDKQCENLGLRYEKLITAIDVRSNKDREEKSRAIEIFSGYSMQSEQLKAYKYAYNSWYNSMASRKRIDSICIELTSLTKVILGAGNASVLDIGFQLNKPWGVPYISGSTIKGFLSSFLARHGGESWWRHENTSEKSKLQVEIFGGAFGEKSYSGSVCFNDAWLEPDAKSWYEHDIITVHHQEYYSEKADPSGMNNPIPISILTLRPKLTFFLSMQGDLKTLNFLYTVLEEALKIEGLGSKTAVGYGRFTCKNISQELIIKEDELRKADLAKAEAENKKNAEIAKNNEKERLAKLEESNKKAREDAITKAPKGSIQKAILTLQNTKDGVWDFANTFLKKSEKESWNEDEIELAKLVWKHIEKEKPKNLPENKKNMYEKIKFKFKN